MVLFLNIFVKKDTMRKIFITLLLVVGAFSTSHSQEALTWQTDINKAISISKQENKPLFLFFTGSDWCGWCIRLQKEVFKTPEFEAWAKEKVVLVELDFPRRTPQPDAIKMQNNQLQQFFEVRGYPTVWFVKAGGLVDGKTSLEKLGSSGYAAGGPSVWLGGADKIIANFVPFTAEQQEVAKKEAERVEKEVKKAEKEAKKAAKKKK